MVRSDGVIALRTQIIHNLREWRIPEYSPQELEDAVYIGSGGSGTKANVHWKQTGDGKLVAIKCLVRGLEERITEADGDSMEEAKRERLFQYFERECVLWHWGSEDSDDPRSSKIVRLLGFASSYYYSIFPALVMELYAEGDLRALVSTRPELGEKNRLALLLDAAIGLAYLHEPHLMIVHRDIKGRNILVRKEINGTLSAAIGDFGSAKVKDPQVFPIVNSSFTESLAWTPPEYVINGREDYSNPTIYGDVWSFGCTILEVMSGSDPWSGRPNFIRNLSRELSPPHPPRPKCFKQDSAYWELVRSCFLLPPERRPTGRILEMRLRKIHEAL